MTTTLSTPLDKNLKPEFSVEINSHDAHMIIRCDNRKSATNYIRLLFPDNFTEQHGGTEFVFTKSYEDGKVPVGTISDYRVPKDWATNRRIERQAA